MAGLAVVLGVRGMPAAEVPEVACLGPVVGRDPPAIGRVPAKKHGVSVLAGLGVALLAVAARDVVVPRVTGRALARALLGARLHLRVLAGASELVAGKAAIRELFLSEVEVILVREVHGRPRGRRLLGWNGDHRQHRCAGPILALAMAVVAPRARQVVVLLLDGRETGRRLAVRVAVPALLARLERRG